MITILSKETFGTHFSEIWMKMLKKKNLEQMHLKMSSWKCQPFRWSHKTETTGKAWVLTEHRSYWWRGSYIWISFIYIYWSYREQFLKMNGILKKIYSLWPSDTIWQHRTRSAWAQVMACCLIAPSHYLDQCWLNINEVLWHSIHMRTILQWVSGATILYNEFDCYICEISITSTRDQWVNVS